MERKNVIEPDCFRDHTNACSNYFYLIWYGNDNPNFQVCLRVYVDVTFMT